MEQDRKNEKQKLQRSFPFRKEECHIRDFFFACQREKVTIGKKM